MNDNAGEMVGHKTKTNKRDGLRILVVGFYHSKYSHSMQVTFALNQNQKRQQQNGILEIIRMDHSA